MEQAECSETSAYKIQTPGNYPEENIQQGNECYATKNFMAENFLISKKIWRISWQVKRPLAFQRQFCRMQLVIR
jgi:hypothetical protein